jgi:MPBQ/MSBQ methyltransferase
MGRDEKSLDTMYGEADLSQHPMFQGGFINFGYWKGIERPWNSDKRARSSAQLYELALDGLALQPTDAILEVGCGRGLGLKLLHDKMPQARLTGVDGSPAQVDRCRIGGVPAEVLYANAERLPFINASFDKVVSVEAVQHFHQPEKFLKEAARVLRPGGRIAIATFFLLGETGRAELENLIPTVRQKIDRVIPVEQFESAMEAAGFVVDQRLAIGAEVWEALDQWLELAYPTEWGRNWVVAYREKLLDYFLLTARNVGSGTS